MGAGDSVRIETEAVLERHQTGSPKNVLTRVNYVHPSGHHLKASRLQPHYLTRESIPVLGLARCIIEPDIGSVKCTMGLEHLRGQSPESLEREIWTAMLTYNLVRLKMMQSGYSAERELRSMSFTETYQLLSTNWLLCACAGVNEAMVASAQAQGVCAIVGNRPDRSEPRENKRRPKVLKLMNVLCRIYHAMLAALSKVP